MKNSITLFATALGMSALALFSPLDTNAQTQTCPSTGIPNDLASSASYEVDVRVANADPATGLDMYTSRTLTQDVSWNRNPGSWTQKGAPLDFTGVAGMNDDTAAHASGYEGGLTMITPRHFVAANHFKFSNGAHVWFFDKNGNPVKRTVINSVAIPGYNYLTGQDGYTDINVGILDSDVPGSIATYPLIDGPTMHSQLAYILGGSMPDFPIVVFNQSGQASIVQMTVETNNGVGGYTSYPSGPRAPFSKYLVGGDSGQPAFLIINNTPILISTHYTASGGPNLGYYINDINAAIQTLDQNAGVSQSYSARIFDASGFRKYTSACVPEFSLSAGQDQVIALPRTANLSGTFTGNFSTSVVKTFSWSKASGPSTVDFSSPSSLQTGATFHQSGNYVLRLTVTLTAYGQQPITKTSDVAVTVNPEPTVQDFTSNDTSYYTQQGSPDYTQQGSPDYTQSTITTSSLDRVPPYILSSFPNGTLSSGTRNTVMNVYTDEPAICRYSTAAGTAYDKMSGTLTFIGGMTNTTALSGLTPGTSYRYYVRCSDTSSNVDQSDYSVLFAVAAAPVSSADYSPAPNTPVATDTVPPVVSIGYPLSGIAISPGSVTFSASASDLVGVAGVSFYLDGRMIGQEDTSGPYSTTVSVSAGTHSIYAVARDTSGNTGVSPTVIFTVRNSSIPTPTPQQQNNRLPPMTLYVPPSANNAPSNVPPATYYPTYEQPSQNTYIPRTNSVDNYPSKITQNLRIGDYGQEGLLVEQTRSRLGYAVATSGPGSPGMETSSFDQKTKDALRRYQEQYKESGIEPTGALDGVTILLLNSDISKLNVLENIDVSDQAEVPAENMTIGGIDITSIASTVSNVVSLLSHSVYTIVNGIAGIFR